MRFLIVDDSRAMQSIVKRGLEKAGYADTEIKLADNGRQALDIIRDWEPDLVLSDWHMPEMDGIALLAEIRQQMLNIKTGFITTEHAPAKIQEALDAGAYFVVSKPFSHDDLLQAILPVIQGGGTAEQALEEKQPQQKNNHFILPSATGFAKIVNAFSNSDILVDSTEPIKIQDKAMPCLLGMFNDGETEVVRAICVLELRAACILGAAINGLSHEQVHTAIAQKTIDKRMVDGCQKALTVVSAAVYDSATHKNLELGSVNVVPKSFGKLEEIYAKRTGTRSDFEIAVIGSGQGLMTFITA